MSKKLARLKELLAHVNDLQDQIETIESSIRRKNRRKDRKQFRKNFRNDPMLRLMIKIERQMFDPNVSDMEPGQAINTFIGVAEQVQ